MYGLFIHRFFCRAFPVLPVLLILLGSGAPAQAHALNNGYSNLTIQGKSIAYDLFLPGNDLLRFDTNGDGQVDPAELGKERDAVRRYLQDGVRIEGDAGPMTMSLGGMETQQNESVPGILFHLTYTSSMTIDSFTLQYNLMFDKEDPNHLNFLLVQDGNDADQTVLEFDDRTYHFQALHPHTAQTLWKYYVIGIFHIWTGYDHMLFLLSLLLLAPRFRDIAKIVTSFTVAHSITLFLAATGAIPVNPRWVEAGIALSICYVAAENPFLKKVRLRWIGTFAFGLIHGLGFAGALAEIGLPKSHLVGSLLAFNLGVETGQLAVVLAILPLMLGLRRTSWYREVMVAASGLIFLVAFYWFLQRVGVVS